MTDKYITEGQHNIMTKKSRNGDVIIVQEKYDGSNVAVAKTNGDIVALMRAGYEAKTSPYIQHVYFDHWVNAKRDIFDSILNEGERICGEWCMQCSSIRYAYNGGIGPFIAFDIYNSNNERLSYLDFISRVGDSVHPARLLHIGKPIDIADSMRLLNSNSLGDNPIHAKELPEGVVYRVERHGKVDFLAKYVRSDFIPGQCLPGIGRGIVKEVWNVRYDELMCL